MELPYGINKRYGSLGGFVLIAIWAWVAFDRPYTFPTHIPWNIYANSPQSAGSDVFDFPPLVSTQIQSLCANASWTSSVILKCENASGGVAEVRNKVLTCVRFAIAAGSGLLLPKIKVEGDHADVGADLGFYFDLEHFGQSLSMSCPQLQMHNTIPGEITETFALSPRTIPYDLKSSEGFGAQWSKGMHSWLRQRQREPLTPSKPAVVELKDTYLSYPVLSDSPLFAQHFGKILKVRQDARELATRALVRMRKTWKLKMDLNQPILEHAFLGSYLDTRTPGKEASEVDREYAQYSSQLELFLDQAARMNLTTVYLASAVEEDIPRFTADAKAHDIKVATKLDLLKKKDLESLLALTAEQQVLVDFLVFGRGSGFVGIGAGEDRGGLVWNVALRRHQFAQAVVDTEEDGDGLSWIFGDDGTHEEFVVGMWP